MRLREDLRLKATLIANAINPEHVAALSFTAADESLHVFKRMRRQLASAAGLLGIHEIYGVARRGDRFVFGPAICPPEHTALPPPGSPLEKPPPELERMFATGQSTTTKPFWGADGQFVTAFVPVLSSRSGEILMALGIASDASSWQAVIDDARSPPIVITLIFLAIFLISYLVIVKRQRLRERSQQYLPHAETAFCLIALTILALTFARQAYQKETRERANAFVSSAYSHMSVVSRKFMEIGKTLEAIEGLFASSDHVSSQEFHSFIRQFLKNGASEAFAWLPEVPGSERAAFEAAVRREGKPGFSIWQLDNSAKRVPAAARDMHYPVLYVEPQSRYAHLSGFDMGTYPGVGETIRSCMDEHLPTATGTIRLLHRNGSACSLVIFFHPVKNISRKGLLTANVRLQNLISMPAYKIGSLTKHLSAELFQLEQGAPPVFLTSTENTPSLLADGWSNKHGDRLSIKVPIFCFGKTYALVISAKPEWFKNYPIHQHKIILLGGMLLTAAVTIMVALLTNRRAFLEQKVMDQTTDLRRGRDNLSAVFDAAPAAMLVTDGNSDIVDANLGAEKLFRRKIQNLQHPRLGHLIGCLHCQRPELRCGETVFCHECPLNSAVKSVIAGGEPVCNQDVNVRIKAGEAEKQVWLRVNATPVTFSRQPHVLISLHDITCEIEMQQQLQQASKMDAIGRLAGGVAHDFNNLLQAILGFTELLLSGTDKKDHQYNDLKQIEKAARRAADLTSQLLAFSRRQNIEPRPIDINEAVRTTDMMLRRILGEDIEIFHNLDPDIHPVLADPTQVEQVIINLAVNARDAMPHGGRLSFSTSLARFSQVDTLLIPESLPGSFVCLSVADSGTGISRENLPHIFEPFFTTKLSGKGTGLGLSVIYGIVKQNGGWINVYSEPGQGSNFKIYLPATDQPVGEQNEEPSHPLPISLPGLGKHILLVEDEPEVRDLVSLILRGAGYKVTAHDSAAAAIAAFEQNPGGFDLLFSDIVLGGMNGVDLACLLRKRRPDLPVLLCSGYTDERVRWELIQQEGFIFLTKPCPSAKMLIVIEEALRQVRPETN